MATLDGMQLFESNGQAMCGGAFLLNGTSKADLTVSGPGGWSMEVKAGGRYVVARNPKTAAGYGEIRDEAFQAAQQGLDLFAISRSADLGIKDAETEHITWWPETSGQVLRTTTVVTISLALNARFVVRDADGQVMPDPPRPPVVWHDSLRYFRLAQITDDLFDSYRNLYLALESILDRIAPQAMKSPGKPAEGEGAWFLRALGVADSLVGLAAFASKGSTNPVRDLYNELYVATRTALFHSKGSRPSFLPHTSGKGKRDVAAAVDRLARLYIALAGKMLGTRSDMGGVFTYDGYKWMTEPLTTKLRLHATDDPAAAKPDNEVLNPTGGTVIALATRHAPELDGNHLRSFLGCTTAAEVGRLSRLVAVAATASDTLLAYGGIEGELVLAGVERFECQLGIRQKHAQQPRTYFAC